VPECLSATTPLSYLHAIAIEFLYAFDNSFTKSDVPSISGSLLRERKERASKSGYEG
jgi:hypothetical protein